jgi:hypothetical protein
MRRLLALAIFLGAHVQAEPVKFGDALQAKFHHERCLSCHQFNNPKNNGRAFTSHRSRYLCSKCHIPEVIGLKNSIWLVPDVRLDYTALDAKGTCQQVKHNLGDDEKRMRDHLLQDGRIRWAIESGMTPGGKKETVPGGYPEWERDVRAWIKDGMRCE